VSDVSNSEPSSSGIRETRLPRPSLTEWLCLVAGLFLVQHYAWLYDDAFVYFRYVDNLIHLDYGLVYNQGEYAEGYSSPLWALILIVLRAMGLSYWPIVLLIAYAGFLAYWWALVVLNHRIVGDRSVSVNLPLCYSTFVYALGAYFTSGLESPLIHVAAIAYAILIFNPASSIAALLVAISPLIRPELALPLVLSVICTGFRLRRVPWLLVSTAFVSNATWLVFRITYYADLFPTTYYLKNIVDIPQGLIYLNNTMGVYHAWALLITGAVAFALLSRRESGRDWQRLPERLVILVIAGSVAAYAVKIGGNAQHFRYLSFSFCLAVSALAGIPEWALSRWRAAHSGPSSSHGATAQGAALGLGVIFALWGFIGYPPQLSSHPFRAQAESEWVDRIYDSYWHRHHDPFVKNIMQGWDQIELYELFRSEDPALQYRGIESGFWCGDNYRRFHLRIIHSLGLTEPILARVIMASDRPSHKFGLIPLAEEMRDLQRIYSTEPGSYRRAVEAGEAPAWIANNLESIEQIEAKSRNRHRFFENLKLALTPIAPIDPGELAPVPPEKRVTPADG
jgi:hypothetical protein